MSRCIDADALEKEGWSLHRDIQVDKNTWEYQSKPLRQVPTIEPERKTGRWIKTARWGRVYYCDQCRNYLDFDGVNAGRGSTNFCPNCGVRMEGEGC